MDLAAAATYFCTTSLEAYVPASDTWLDEDLEGNIVPTDRFITIYNRPAHLRQLTYTVGASLPASGILRNPATGEIYLVGQTREDTRGGTVYVGTVLLHLVTGYAGAKADLHRKAPVGPGNDPGFIVDSVVTKSYFDVELRSASEVDDQVASSRGEFLMWTAATVPLNPWDFVQINSDWYRVHQVYFDSGFQMARVFKEDDDRENLVYKRKTSGYNADTGVAGGYTSYNITGLIDTSDLYRFDDAGIAPNEVDLRVLTGHIGLTPSVSDEFTSAAGITYSVTRVSKVGTRDEWVIRGQS